MDSYVDHMGYGSKVLPLEESSRVPLIIYDPLRASKASQKRTSELTCQYRFCTHDSNARRTLDS